MEQRTVRHHISTLRRHFGFKGEDILACYDTAIVGLFPMHCVKYATVSISPAHWKELQQKLGDGYVLKHPGSNVECLKLFDGLYVRKETRVPDDSVLWLPGLGCYGPTSLHLNMGLDKVIMSASSTKKQIGHASTVLAELKLNMKA